MSSEWTPPERTLTDVLPRARRSRPTLSALYRHEVSSLPIRVPPIDWENVAGGEKDMFRTYAGRIAKREESILPAGLVLPRPVVAFTQRNDRSKSRAAALMILEEHRQEPLGSISPADREREGFEFLGSFRWYWKQRHRTIGWRPWEMINVVVMRPPVKADWEWCGERLMNDLFEEWI